MGGIWPRDVGRIWPRLFEGLNFKRAAITVCNSRTQPVVGHACSRVRGLFLS